MKILSLIAILCFALALVAACSSSDKTTSPSPSPSATRATTSASPAALTTTPAALTATATASPAGATATAAASACATNPKPGTPDTVKVDSPAAGTTITSPVTVTGRILAFEATFRIRIYDATGNILVDEQAMSAQGQVLSPFSKAVTFSVARQTPACLWVFELSAADGSPTNVAQVAVTLQP